MISAEKTKRAKEYIEKLANGINPLTNKTIPDNDVINDVKISRCLFYVADLIDDLLANEENKVKSSKITQSNKVNIVDKEKTITKINVDDKNNSKPISNTKKSCKSDKKVKAGKRVVEELSKKLIDVDLDMMLSEAYNIYLFKETILPISTSAFAKKINGLAKYDSVKPINSATITNWLVSKGYIEKYYKTYPNGKRYKTGTRITQKGDDIGLTLGKVEDEYGIREALFCNTFAQRLIINNIEEVLRLFYKS